MEFAYADVRLGHEPGKETSVYQARTEPQGQDADELGSPRDHPGSPILCISGFENIRPHIHRAGETRTRHSKQVCVTPGSAVSYKGRDAYEGKL